MDKHRVATCFGWGAAAALLAFTMAGCGDQQRGATTPAGYWEGTVTTKETPMKDANKSLTRTVDAEFWFTVAWDPVAKTGTLTGEAEAKYDAELKVENLPKVTVPAPGGASVSFEPSVGGKLTGENRRKFPVVGVLVLDDSGSGTLVLAKASSPEHARAGLPAPWDAPMEFTLRADPGVKGGISGKAGSLNYDTRSGQLGGSANFGGLDKGKDAKAGKDQGSVSQGVNTGRGGDLIVQKIPMTPFTPFREGGGKVVKRPGGPYAASFEEKDEKISVKWNAKQMGGEQREPLKLTPEMRDQAEKMLKDLRRR
jgi:hypothetical protein